MSEQRTLLIWGQRVRTDAGWVGQYEGILCAERPDLLRVSWMSKDGSGVCYLTREQLTAIPEHPVCLARRLRAAGVRPPRRARTIVPACYLKDYGKTMADLASDAFSEFLAGELGDAEAIAFLHLCGNPPENHSRDEIMSRLTGAMLHLGRIERCPPKLRRIAKGHVGKRRRRPADGERRTLHRRRVRRLPAFGGGAQ